MPEDPAAAPDSSAVRVALWRALHLQIDPPPHIVEDEIGLRLVDPPDGWQQRPDMDPQGTRPFRISIVARARFIEDLVLEQVIRGVSQYVILGAGLDSFAQRKPKITSGLRIFEIDRPGPQKWKRQRLIELGYGIPDWLRFVPVDFEQGDSQGESWLDRLKSAGFNSDQPAVVAAAGVSMYLQKESVVTTLQRVAAFAPGSTLVMTFILPMDQAAPEERPGREAAERGARASGTPFLSFFTPREMLALARDTGFKRIHHISGADLTARYIGNASSGLRTSSSEELLIANT